MKLLEAHQSDRFIGYWQFIAATDRLFYENLTC